MKHVCAAIGIITIPIPIALVACTSERQAEQVDPSTEDGDRERHMDNAPAWSPDGTTLLFQRNNLRGEVDLFVVSIDGAQERRLTDEPLYDGHADWSPDGNRIAFCTNRDGNEEIYVMDADGSNPVNLTRHPATDCSPAWSRDGTRILFASDRSGSSDLYLIGAAGGQPTRLTETAGSSFPTKGAWSPDDARIVFSSTMDTVVDEANTSFEKYNAFEIYAMDADGSNRVQLTDNGSEDSYATWSPDGITIAFVHYDWEGGTYDIHTMAADGSSHKRLTRLPSYQYDPAWSPDAKHLAFYSTESGEGRLYIMEVDGSHQRQVTY